MNSPRDIGKSWDVDPTELDFPEFVEAFNAGNGWRTTLPQFRMAEFLQDTMGDKRRMLQAFRESGKSHITGLLPSWVLRRDPNWTVIVCSAQMKPVAERQAVFIRSTLENFWVCEGMKPKKTDLWQQLTFTINRDNLDGTPSVAVTSIDSSWTGAHANLLLGDDLEISENCRTEDEREYLAGRVGELAAICNYHLYVGTPHAEDSIYVKLEDQHLSNLKKLKIPVIDQDGNPANPDVPVKGEIQDEDWIDLRRASKSQAWFNSQYLLIPSSVVKTKFRMENIRLFSNKLEVSELAMSGIGAFTNDISKFWIGEEPIKDLIGYWDPASGHKNRDDSVLAVVASTEAGNYYVLGLVVLPELDLVDDQGSQLQCEAVVHACDEFHLDRVVVEANFSATLAAELRRTAKSMKRKIGVKSATRNSTQNKFKFIADTLDGLIQTGRLYIHQDAWDDTQIGKQLREFGPKMRKDDFVDSISGAIDQLKGVKPKPGKYDKGATNSFHQAPKAVTVNGRGSFKVLR